MSKCVCIFMGHSVHLQGDGMWFYVTAVVVGRKVSVMWESCRISNQSAHWDDEDTAS